MATEEAQPKASETMHLRSFSIFLVPMQSKHTGHGKRRTGSHHARFGSNGLLKCRTSLRLHETVRELGKLFTDTKILAALRFKEMKLSKAKARGKGARFCTFDQHIKANEKKVFLFGVEDLDSAPSQLGTSHCGHEPHSGLPLETSSWGRARVPREGERYPEIHDRGEEGEVKLPRMMSYCRGFPVFGIVYIHRGVFQILFRNGGRLGLVVRDQGYQSYQLDNARATLLSKRRLRKHRNVTAVKRAVARTNKPNNRPPLPPPPTPWSLVRLEFESAGAAQVLVAVRTSTRNAGITTFAT